MTSSSMGLSCTSSVETGCWSESGAAEIVAFLTRGPDVLMKLDLTKTQKSTPQLRRSVIS